MPRFDGWDHGRSSGAPSSHLRPLGSAPRSHGPRPFRSGRHPETVQPAGGISVRSRPASRAYPVDHARRARERTRALAATPTPRSPPTGHGRDGVPGGRQVPDVRDPSDRRGSGRGPAPHRQGGSLTPEQREARRAARAATVPPITYPEHLPVVDRRDDIAAAIRDHQVVVIAGETGSGKTTQIPKICLELGRGLDGVIGHTQPRRIAARAVAERLSEELAVELGTAVGYQVRFTDQSSRDTLVKVMTDGILLAEMQRDRDLRRYDTIIIDEAHERSLNIDFILGYLKQLLPRRPDLKVVITSATIDPQRFAEHFADPATGEPAPIIEVSGRTFPVEIRYRPLVDPDRPEAEERDMVTGVCEAVEELWTERHSGTSSDILVFFSGEREIRDAADALNGMKLPVTEVVPLYGRLSAAEQHRVFSSHTGRRIVLATNVAETSLTVPGIRYVIDTGTARISRYSQRTKVQRLPIEPVSQASANQRSGRCGRVSDGIAIRLYSEDDFDSRPEFTDPEILRTNLASVILQMTSLGLGDIARFPFVDPPDSRQITDGVRLLEELQAFSPEDDQPAAAGGRRRPGRRLTAYGRTIATLPIDPRHARMVIEADKRGVLREVLVIVAALSIQDPRERPQDKQELANASHKRFADETSDFVTWLNLWAYLKEQQKELSSSAFRRMCKAEFLHYLRIREWQDLHSQVKQAAKQAGLDVSRGTRPRGRGRDRRRRDPPVPARRPPLARRCPRRAEAGVCRRARHAVRHQSRVGPLPQAAPVRHGRGARRDEPPVGARQRPHRPGVGRTARRAPRETAVLRAALVGQAGVGRRDRAGHPLRRAARRRVASSASAASTPSSHATSSSGTPSSRATGTPSTPSCATTPPSSSVSESSRRAPAGATSSSTTAR